MEMKLEVLKDFNDAVSGELHKVGDVFEAKAERAKELLAHPLKLVKEAGADAKAAEVEVAEKVEDAVETADKKPVVKKAKKPAAKK